MPDDDGIMSRDDAKMSDDAAAGIISADDGLKFIAACKKGIKYNNCHPLLLPIIITLGKNVPHNDKIMLLPEMAVNSLEGDRSEFV